MAGTTGTPKFFASPEEFGAWLERHGETKAELLVGYWKVGSGKPSMTWAQSVEQALRFGWIDGVRRSLGADSYSIRFTPRKRGSHWSAINVATAQRLARDGRMAPAGAAAFAARRGDRIAQTPYGQAKPLKLGAAETRRLKADAKAWAWFSKAPPSYRRACAWWIQTAKRPETKRRRLDLLIAHSRKGEVMPQYRWRKAKGKATKPAAKRARRVESV